MDFKINSETDTLTIGNKVRKIDFFIDNTEDFDDFVLSMNLLFIVLEEDGWEEASIDIHNNREYLETLYKG